MSKILVRFNALGPQLSERDLQIFQDGSMDQTVRKFLSQHLEWFFGLQAESITDDMLSHLVEVPIISITPTTQKLEERIIGPLTSARCLYCFKEYLATIALCGIISEMLTIFIWDINAIDVENPHTLTVSQKQALAKKSFEELDQSARIEILKSTSLVQSGSAMAKNFGDLRGLRRPYMHLLKTDHSRIREDAKRAFQLALDLLEDVLQIELVESSSIKVNPAIIKLFE